MDIEDVSEKCRVRFRLTENDIRKQFLENSVLVKICGVNLIHKPVGVPNNKQ